MRILAVDDEKIALEGLMNAIKKVVPDAELHGFRSPHEALELAKEKQLDIAFLDIEMREMDGIALAKHLKAISPMINIIFTTGYSEYSGSAFALHASGYVRKPITAEKISYEIMELRNPVAKVSDKRLKIRAFGNFEVYVNNKPLVFKYTKSKEMLAYLVDRCGALCSNNEIMCILWEDDDNIRNHTSYLKNTRADLIATLEEAGCGDVLERQRGTIGILSDKVDCDYLDYKQGKISGINAYMGEYMTQYSWSEATHGILEDR